MSQCPPRLKIDLARKVRLDVWAADRAELQEHTLYFAAFAQMLTIVVVLVAVGRIKGVWPRRQEHLD
jgi:hypothetical protein